MAYSLCPLLLLLLTSCSWSSCRGQVLPSEALLRWSAYEMGAMISWNIDTMDGIQGCNIHMPALPEPKLFDTAVNVDFESWAKVMQSVGIRYCVLTVKHGCGFTLWPSKVTGISGLPVYNYTIANNPLFAKRDLLAEFVAAMHKYNIQPGFYYSLGSNVYLGVASGKASPPSTKPIPGQIILEQDAYYEVVYQHMIELLSAYPNVTEMWYDGGVPEPIHARLVAAYQKYASETVVFQGFGLTPNAVRWVGTESGHPTRDMWSTSDAAGGPSVDGDYWYPAECDTTMQNHDNWFFNKDAGSRSLEEMKSVYHDTVGNNCNLMLNLAPDTTGTVHYLKRTALSATSSPCVTLATSAITLRTSSSRRRSATRRSRSRRARPWPPTASC
ncbi:uncharacterized protein LOC135821133 [Sycon ciliatum]|uniref:uncharacterized protein LOC135821133 n=1 Tax=Sycon ciliatum TaxID=27933 RepID=UPI0031F6E363